MAGFFALLEPLALRLPAGLLLGAIVGSFLATVLIRWPKGESALGGRSRCDSCREALGPLALVPIVSLLAARGRCRRCGARIDRRHVAIELAAAFVGLAAFAVHPLPLALVTAVLGWWLLLISALDLEHHWLPDLLTLPLIPLGIAAAWAGFGPPLPERLAGAAIGWATLALITLAYARLRGREGMGGGDPKLLGAIGAWLGAFQLPFVLLGAGLLGLVAILSLRLRGQEVTAMTRLPLGTLMALAAWPLWLLAAAGTFSLCPELPC
ncbi:MAG: prepilin peptidase [Sphingosinicella sp.]|uniref:prepilin peptidase n=1 Tax=Sphingosinicella sp. TaxID=1917971 RepID=UPI004037C485